MPKLAGETVLLLTKLDGSPVLINLETVKYFEPVPDTVVFFLNGESFMIKESLEEVQESFVKLRLRMLASPKQ